MKTLTKTVYKTLVVILLLFLVLFFLSRCEGVRRFLKPVVIETTDTVFVDVNRVDTITYARYDTIEKIIVVFKKPDTVKRIDTHFVFSQISTYSDSIQDSFFSFNYSLDVIGSLLDFRYDFWQQNRIVTNKEIIYHNEIGVNMGVGNSFLINLNYKPKASRIVYGVSSLPFEKIYLVNFGYTFKF